MNRLLVYILLVLPLGAAAQDSTRAWVPSGVVATPTGPAEREEAPVRTGIHLEAEALLSNVYESNIDHSVEAVPSVGLVPGLHVRLMDRPENAHLALDYTIAQHAYTNTDRWDRTSHQLGAAYELEPFRDVASVTEAEVSLGGSSEDRDLSNQYQLVQAFEFKLTRMHRVEVYATLRYKTVPADPEGNAFKPNVGVVYQQRWPSGFRWEVGARAETNQEPVEDGNYHRLTYMAEVQVPVPGSQDVLELDLRQRFKHYTARFAEDVNGDDTDQLRRDRQWTLGIAWTHTVLQQVGLELGVELERRTSNDPDKLYVATALVLGLAYRF